MHMRFWGPVGLFLLILAAFLVGQRLSADAVGMAIGVLLGVLAGVPAALLVLVSGRRRQEDAFDDEDEEIDDSGSRRSRHGAPYPALPPQAPVIIFAPPMAQTPHVGEHADGHYANWGANWGHTPPSPPHRRALPAPGQRTVDGGRAFKVVGEQEEWLTEW
ncbi:MAG: hypothetical protein NZ553_09875 [Caldilinea sp.]|nr:hypothetical protein [Caldilinea sp.]MDW8440769.1 hypothetical protein [Caldilineaceae bacterium]